MAELAIKLPINSIDPRCDIRQIGTNCRAQRADICANVTVFEDEIDDMVCALYGLNEGEVAAGERGGAGE